MFEQKENTYSNIVIELGIEGYSEKDIINRGIESETNLPLNLLFSYPHHKTEETEMLFQMMFPDDDLKFLLRNFFH